MGIDATIGEGVPRERYDRIAYAERAKIADYVSGKADQMPQIRGHDEESVTRLAEQISKIIENEPKDYQEIVEYFREYEFRAVAGAMGQLHADGKLWQEPRGRMCLRGSAFAAKPRGQ